MPPSSTTGPATSRRRPDVLAARVLARTAHRPAPTQPTRARRRHRRAAAVGLRVPAHPMTLDCSAASAAGSPRRRRTASAVSARPRRRTSSTTSATARPGARRDPRRWCLPGRRREHDRRLLRRPAADPPAGRHPDRGHRAAADGAVVAAAGPPAGERHARIALRTAVCGAPRRVTQPRPSSWRRRCAGEAARRHPRPATTSSSTPAPSTRAAARRRTRRSTRSSPCSHRRRDSATRSATASQGGGWLGPTDRRAGAQSSRLRFATHTSRTASTSGEQVVGRHVGDRDAHGGGTGVGHDVEPAPAVERLGDVRRRAGTAGRRRSPRRASRRRRAAPRTSRPAAPRP